MVTKIRKGSRPHLYIREWMEALGLTDEKLGERLEKSRVTVYRWRTDQKRLNPHKIAALATAMGIEPEELWRPPGRPSLDVLVKDAPDDLIRKAADVVRIIVKTGT